MLHARPTQMIDVDTLRSRVPSVFATEPWQKMSENYRFVPTINVVNTLADHDFYPVSATQSRTRIPGKGDFTKHMLRFRHKDVIGVPLPLDQNVPEVVLVNSHDGTSAYKFMAGIFRLVCTNGMIVCDSDMGSVSVRHMGGVDAKDFDKRVIDATFSVVDGADQAIEKIEDWKSIELTDTQKLEFAGNALQLKPNLAEHFKPETLLRPRRSADVSGSLWTVFNVIQEHLLKGGDHAYTARGRRTSTRPVKSVTEDVRLNRALWKLADDLAKTVAK